MIRFKTYEVLILLRRAWASSMLAKKVDNLSNSQEAEPRPRSGVPRVERRANLKRRAGRWVVRGISVIVLVLNDDGKSWRKTGVLRRRNAQEVTISGY